MKKVLFIASTGGHLNELLQLKELFKETDFMLITEKTKSNLKLADTYPNRVKYLVFGSKDHLLAYLFKFPYNILKSLVFYLQFRPQFIVSTGAHTAVGMCYIAKLFGSKIIYLETYANLHTKSLSGKLVYPIAVLFLVQWESMLELYPKAKYVGGVY